MQDGFHFKLILKQLISKEIRRVEHDVLSYGPDRWTHTKHRPVLFCVDPPFWNYVILIRMRSRCRLSVNGYMEFPLTNSSLKFSTAFFPLCFLYKRPKFCFYTENIKGEKGEFLHGWTVSQSLFTIFIHNLYKKDTVYQMSKKEEPKYFRPNKYLADSKQAVVSFWFWILDLLSASPPPGQKKPIELFGVNY